MSIPTVAVTCTINGQDGQPIEGAVIMAKLDRDDVYGGFVVKRSVTGTTDSTGVAVLDLFPNALGTNGSQYEIRIITPERTVRFAGTVPNQDCDLSDIVDVEPGPALSLAEQAKLLAMQYRDEALAAKSASEDAQGDAETAASTATVMAGTAMTQAGIATAAATDLASAVTAAETAQDEAESARDEAVAAAMAIGDTVTCMGALDCTSNPNYPAADLGHLYYVTASGRIGGASGPLVEAGDALFCTTDSTAAGDHVSVGANWVILQKNMDGIVVGPSSAVNGRIAVYDGESGQIIKDGGLLVSDLIAKSIGTAAGDIIVFTGSGAPVRLAAGTEGQGLVITAGVPAWGQVATEGGGGVGSAIFLYQNYGR